MARVLGVGFAHVVFGLFAVALLLVWPSSVLVLVVTCGLVAALWSAERALLGAAPRRRVAAGCGVRDDPARLSEAWPGAREVVS